MKVPNKQITQRAFSIVRLSTLCVDTTKEYIFSIRRVKRLMMGANNLANQQHLDILKQGVTIWNTWRKEHPEVQPDLTEADLQNSYLMLVDFSDTNLTGTNLIGANLIAATLTLADLSRASLTWANLSVAFLTQANMTEANLAGVNFNRSLLKGASMSQAKLTMTQFGNVDLSSVNGLENVVHFGPSNIGIDTLIRSQGKIPKIFLRNAGVPDSIIEAIPSLVGSIDYYTCFISHSSKDKRFCNRLYTDLGDNGVQRWYFPEDAIWGEPVWGEIDRGIKLYDKLVVICSENSLQSGPVLREIERALNREDREGKNILFPVRIDDYLFKHWQHPRKDDVMSKVVGDFRGWNRSATKYNAALKKLLRALKAKELAQR